MAMLACTGCGQHSPSDCAFWRQTADVVRVDFAALQAAIQSGSVDEQELDVRKASAEPAGIKSIEAKRSYIQDHERQGGWGALLGGELSKVAERSRSRPAEEDEAFEQPPAPQLQPPLTLQQEKPLQPQEAAWGSMSRPLNEAGVDDDVQRLDAAVSAALLDAEREWLELQLQMDFIEAAPSAGSASPPPWAEEQCAGEGGGEGASQAPVGDLKLSDKQAVDAFLASHGFSDVTAKRRWFMKSWHPLHAAISEENADMVCLLLRAGADPSQRNSAGLTAKEYAAQRHQRRGAPREVLGTLLEKFV